MKYRFIIKENNKLSCFLRLTIFICLLLILFHICCIKFLINKIEYIENLSKNGLKEFKELDDELKDQFNAFYFINENYVIRKRRELFNTCECNNVNLCPRGPPGINGSDGIPGFSGEKGSSGQQGKPFFEIITTTKKIIDECRRCPPGSPGLPGEIGLPGPQGFYGTQGLPGKEGRPGEMGISGYIGEQGSPGIPGIIGEKGLMGIDGIRRLPGLCGLPGSKGSSGTKGEPGYPGICGKPGQPGEIGKTGPRGIKGIPGMMGQHGLPGMVGEVGFDGGYCKCQHLNSRKEDEKEDEKEEYNEKEAYVKDEIYTENTPLTIGIEAKLRNIKIGKTTKKALKISENYDDKKYNLS